jgi:hypothetical protein
LCAPGNRPFEGASVLIERGRRRARKAHRMPSVTQGRPLVGLVSWADPVAKKHVEFRESKIK